MSFADPGPVPEPLTHVPGFIDALAGWTLARSPSPNRVLAFAGALAMLAHLAGRSYTDTHGTRTNLYLVVLGESGIGKDAPRKTNSRLAERVDFAGSLAESFASAEAVEDALAKCPSILLQADEAASFFGKMRGAGGAYVSFPPEIVEAAGMLSAREKAAVSGGVLAMQVVPETLEASRLLEAVKKNCMVLRKNLSDAGMPMARATVVRMNEKIAKLALLWAISENPAKPVITPAAVEWAAALAVYITRWMLYEGQFHSGEGRFGQLRDRAVAALARAGGSLDRRSFIRALGCDLTTFKRLVSTMLVAEVIDEPAYIDGKLVYSLISG